MPLEAIDWTDEIIDGLCAAVASGQSINKVAGKSGFPSQPSIYRRLANDDAFRAKLNKARADQQEFEADEIVRMADEATVEDHQVVKLRIWARQWRAAKLAPKRYGDKITQEHTGPNGGPLQLSDDVAREKLAQLAERMAQK